MSSGPHDDQTTWHINQHWSQSIQRFSELHRLFEDTQLRVKSKDAAQYLGLAGERELEQWLQVRRLARFKLLRNWYYLVVMLERAENGKTIAAWALEKGENPSVYYKFVVSVGAGSWEQWLARGSVCAKRRALELWGVYSAANH